MALPGFIKFDSSMVGAPTMTGQNGSFNAVCNWIVGLVGGTRTYHDGATNQSVFQWPGGHQQSFYVCHDSSLSGAAQRAIWRACDSATGYTYADLVNPYPSVSQVADNSSNVLCSTTANSTARDYAGIAWEGGMAITVQSGGTWWLPPMYIGDAIPLYSGDVYASICSVRNSSNNVITNSPTGQGGGNGMLSGTPCYWFRRSIDGVAVSTSAAHDPTNGGNAALGGITNGPTLSGGYNGNIIHRPLILSCSGSSAGNIPDTSRNVFARAAIPNIRVPMCGGPGTYTHADFLTDSAYSPGCVLRPYFSGSGNTGGVLLEETDTWKAE
jgi:hypothetical protein